MELSVMDRLLILNLDTLPKVGSIVTMKIKQQLIDNVGFNEQESKECGIRQDGEQVKWNPDAKTKEIEIGTIARKILIEAIDKSENLIDGYVSLYDRLQDGGNHNAQVEGGDV